MLAEAARALGEPHDDERPGSRPPDGLGGPRLCTVRVAVVVASVAGLAGALTFRSYQAPAPSGAQIAPAPTPAWGEVRVTVAPQSDIFVDGALVAHGLAAIVPDLLPGKHHVRLAADGYQELEGTVRVHAGEQTRFVRTLSPVLPDVSDLEPERSASVPSPQPHRPDATPATVEFDSQPRGASVSVDRNEIGTTPVTWSGGRAGTYFKVEYSLDGYEPLTFYLEDLEPGSSTRHAHVLEQLRPASLTLALPQGGWADVYIDGIKIEKTAPLRRYPLAPGPHIIEAVNPTAGTHGEAKVELAPGQHVELEIRLVDR